MRSTVTNKIGYCISNAVWPCGIKVKMKNFSSNLPADCATLFSKNYEDEHFQFINNSSTTAYTVLHIGGFIALIAVLFGHSEAHNSLVFSFEPTLVSKVVIKEDINTNNLENYITLLNRPVIETLDN